MNAPLPRLNLPDHTQLPDKDGIPVRNDLEPAQGALLTQPLRPVLWNLYPDGLFWIGQDCGIYWRLPMPPEPVLRGAISPDWYCVLGVPTAPPGSRIRRSYVLWQERVTPSIAIEYVSGDGSEERDRTPQTGKFWIYEQAIGIPYYVIYELDPGRIEVYRRIKGHYRQQRPNKRGHFPIAPFGTELGLWQGSYQDREIPWLRWFDAQGQMLLCDTERAQQAERQLEDEQHQRKQAQRRAARLARKLRELGIDPDA